MLSRTREQKDKVFYAFMVISHSAASHAKVISYFDRFPLYSSKYLAYKDWSFVVEQTRLRAGKALTQKEISEVEMIKAQFNSKRKSFDFSHLEKII
jgi:predicted rRNA methylase YqxC with S4 and FtsJ domains